MNANGSCRALSEVIGEPLPYDTVHDLRLRLHSISPSLVRYDEIERPSPEIIRLGLETLSKSTAQPSAEPLKKPIQDFYRTDPISRASVTMADCSKAFTRKDYHISNVDESGAQASYA